MGKPHHCRIASRDMRQNRDISCAMQRMLMDKLPIKCALCTTSSGKFNEIGSGSFAKVYLGYISSNQEKYGTLPAVFKIGEIQGSGIQRLLACSGHESIVQIYAWALDPKDIYGILVTEPMPTDLLRCVMPDKNGVCIVSTANGMSAQVIARLFCAVGHLHDMGIAHCDLKAENVLCNPFVKDTQGGIIVKVADFGLAQLIIDKPQLMNNCGSPKYQAPELSMVGRPDTVGHPDIADVWSLGILCYVLVYADWPPSEGQMHESYPPMPTPSHSSVTKWLNPIKDMLTGNSNERPPIEVIRRRYPVLGATSDVLQSRTNTCPATPPSPSSVPPSKKQKGMYGQETFVIRPLLDA